MRGFIFISFLIFCYQTQAQSKYDLFDPRNPDCPCHKLQKQAEQEYAQLNGKKETTGRRKNSGKKNAKLVAEMKFRWRSKLINIKKNYLQNDMCYKW